MKVPQDSMLKRHFVTHLRSLIESKKHPRPTDSMLRRHYDTMVDFELQKQLEDLGS